MRGDVPGLGFFDTPMGARPLTGVRDELGRQVYVDAGGNQFAVGQEAPNALADAPYNPRAPGRPQPQRSGTGASAAPPAWMQGIGNALVQGFTAPGRAAQGEPVTHGDAWATALDYGVMGAPMAAPEGALRANSFRAYHGSPHTFDQFDMGKLGTGEGAQAYGHGLYFAENEGVARGYRDTLSYGRAIDDPANAAEIQRINRLMNEQIKIMDAEGVPGSTMNDPAYLSEAGYAAEAEYNNLQNQISQLYPGSMYEVQINADPNTFLDWDAPLSQQPEAVRNALASADPDMWHPSGGDYDPTELGQTAYARLGNMRGTPFSLDATLSSANPTHIMPRPAAATDALRDAGVPGIRYLDAGSRAAGDGSRNFVVFDDKIIQVLRRYGIGAAAIGGGWTVSPEEYDAVLGGA